MEKDKKKKCIINDNVRLLIIKKVEDDGETISKVSKDLQINYKTIYSIIKIYRESGRFLKNTVKGCPKNKITPEIGNFIEKMVEHNPSITLKDMAKSCAINLNEVISMQTINRYLRDLKITLKRSSIILDRVNDNERLKQRKDFATFFLTNASTDDRQNIFIDESGFNLHLRRNYGRSIAGKRSSIVVPTIRGKNITLLSSINNEKIIHYKILSGSCNSEIFSNFLRELDEILVRDYNITNGYMFMDNAPAHKSHATHDIMKTLRNKTKFLSAYSYMLNPIEFSFGKIKCFVRKNLGQTEADIKVLVPLAIAEITTEDCLGWFRLIRRNCALAMQMHKFDYI